MKKVPVYLIIFLAAVVYFMPFFVQGKFFNSTENNANMIAGEAVGNAAVFESVNLPIVMYHSVLKSRRGKYIVNPSQFEQDIVKYLNMGYTPVFLRDVINYVEGNGTLPRKPMVITLDDGHYNNMHYALPIIRKYNVKVVINVITSYCEATTESGDHSNPNYSSLTWSQINQLANCGLVEIGNHSHAMHKLGSRLGISRKNGEDEQTYISKLTTDIEKAQELLTKAGVPAPTTFAYPFGKYNKQSRELLCNLGFKALLTCTEGISRVNKGDPESLLTLKRYNRSGNISTDSFIKKVFSQLEKQEKVYK